MEKREKLKNILSDNEWLNKVESIFYIKNIKRHIRGSSQLTIQEQLKILKYEKKRLKTHLLSVSEISDSENDSFFPCKSNILLEIRLQQLQLIIEDIRHILVSNQIKTDILELEEIIHSVV